MSLATWPGEIYGAVDVCKWHEAAHLALKAIRPVLGAKQTLVVGVFEFPPTQAWILSLIDREGKFGCCILER